MPVTLVAVSGMSPAILTETVWALAREKPAVVPDEVVVITTTRGEQDLRTQLLSPLEAWGGAGVWAALRQEVFSLVRAKHPAGKLQLSIRVIDLPNASSGVREKAVDIRTREQNEEAANFIVQTLAPLVDAEDQQVIASIAGGRKTMGALLYAAMSLLGKETDRVTHVLVSDPFETVRGFYYPSQPVQGLPVRAAGQPDAEVQAADARVELADLPFVPLRNKFAELNEPRRSFAALVDCYARAERPLSGVPRVRLDVDGACLVVQEKRIPLSGRCLVVTSFLYDRAADGKRPYEDPDEATGDYEAYFTRWRERHPFHPKTLRYVAVGDARGDLTKGLHELRSHLTKHGAANAIPYLAPERSRIGFDVQVQPEASTEAHKA